MASLRSSRSARLTASMRRSRAFAVVPPVATFVIGLLVSVSTDVFGKSYLSGTKDRAVLVAVIAILALLGGLFILSGMHHAHIRENADQLSGKLDEIQRQLNLSAEFIDDKAAGGMSYERTAELIRNAKQNVRCVDFWVQPPTPDSAHEGASRATAKQRGPEGLRRQRYYEALEEKTQEFSLFRNKDIFYKRIVQMDDGADVGVDPRYQQHLGGCISDLVSDAAAIRVAKPQIQMNFTIIDDRYVIWPIMTTNPTTKTVERFGAILFNDPGEQLVSCLRSLFIRLDNSADALNRTHLRLGLAE